MLMPSCKKCGKKTLDPWDCCQGEDDYGGCLVILFIIIANLGLVAALAML